MVLKDKLLIEGDQTNWAVCLKVLIRESLFYGKKETWDQITPLSSPEARGTIFKFSKERVHREEFSKSVNLMSVVFARPSLRRGHKRKPSTNKDALAEQHGTWRRIFTSSNIRTRQRSSLIEPKATPALQNYWRYESSWLILELQCWAKRIWAQMNWKLCGDPETPKWKWQPMEKCKQMRKHKDMFAILDSSWLSNYSKIHLQFNRLESSAKKTDIPMSGPAFKNPGRPKKGRNSFAKRTISHLFVIPGLSSRSGTASSSTSPVQDLSASSSATEWSDELAPGNWSETNPITKNQK